MLENKFREEDAENSIKFLNFIAKHAEFKLDTKNIIEYYKLLNWAQTSLVPKIKANILEIKKVHKPEKKAKGKNK